MLSEGVILQIEAILKEVLILLTIIAITDLVTIIAGLITTDFLEIGVDIMDLIIIQVAIVTTMHSAVAICMEGMVITGKKLIKNKNRVCGFYFLGLFG